MSFVRPDVSIECAYRCFCRLSGCEIENPSRTERGSWCCRWCERRQWWWSRNHWGWRTIWACPHARFLSAGILHFLTESYRIMNSADKIVLLYYLSNCWLSVWDKKECVFKYFRNAALNFSFSLLWIFRLYGKIREPVHQKRLSAFIYCHNITSCMCPYQHLTLIPALGEATITHIFTSYFSEMHYNIFHLFVLQSAFFCVVYQPSIYIHFLFPLWYIYAHPFLIFVALSMLHVIYVT